MRQRDFVLLLLLLAATIAIVFSGESGVQIPNATAVTVSAGIGAYWDRYATNSCRSISWGQLAPGAKKTVLLYLKNEGNDSIYYLLTTEQWYPVNAPDYITLQSDYSGTRATSGSVRRISLTLAVSHRIHGIVDFNFDIVFMGSPYGWGDVNHDSKVDGKDLSIISKAFGSVPGSPTWNSIADLNQDGKIDGKDIGITSQNFGKTYV